MSTKSFMEEVEDSKIPKTPSGKRPKTFGVNTDSYVIPYTIIGGVSGIALTYLTESPIFLLGIPLGGAFGMIRDKNIKTKSNGMVGSAMKVVGVYVLGVPLMIAGGVFVVAVWVKAMK